MNKEPSVLTRMRLSCCWGDNLNEKELNEVVDYINYLQQENKILRENAEHNDKAVDKANWENRLLKNRIDEAIEYAKKSGYEISNGIIIDILKGYSNE